MQAEDILHFWFEELSPAQHFAQEDAIDAMIRVRFGPIWQAAQHCELWEWRATPQGRLAEIVVLDQFSRHIHRGTPLAFAQDAQALVLAQELVAGGHDATLPPAQRAFAYLPYMHSESPATHGPQPAQRRSRGHTGKARAAFQTGQGTSRGGRPANSRAGNRSLKPDCYNFNS